MELLNSLGSKGFITVYGFVIMPNHLHFLWEMLKMNGKEMPHASFNKATAHGILKDLKANHLPVTFSCECCLWMSDTIFVYVLFINKPNRQINIL